MPLAMKTGLSGLPSAASRPTFVCRFHRIQVRRPIAPDSCFLSPIAMPPFLHERHRWFRASCCLMKPLIPPDLDIFFFSLPVAIFFAASFIAALARFRAGAAFQ